MGSATSWGRFSDARHRVRLPGPGQQVPVPSGQANPGGDLLGHILREFEKGIREGRIKPVIIGGGGPIQIPIPGGQAGPSPAGDQPQLPDIFGQILRDMLGGGAGGQLPRQGQPADMKDLSDKSKGLGLMDGVGAAVFGDRLEAGREVERSQLDSIQQVFDRFLGTQRR